MVFSLAAHNKTKKKVASSDKYADAEVLVDETKKILKTAPKRPYRQTILQKAERKKQNKITTRRPKKDDDDDVDLKQQADKVQSIFQKKLKKLRSVSKVSGFNEKYTQITLEAMFEQLVDLIPIAEKNFRISSQKGWSSERAAYALNTYQNQLREIINDLRAIDNFEDRAERINSIINEHIRLILQNVSDELTRIRNRIIEKLDIKNIQTKDAISDILRDALNRHGGYLNETNKLIEAKINNFLIDNKKKKG